MSDDFKPWRRNVGIAVLAAMCLFSGVYSIATILKGGGLKFHLEVTEYAIEFGIDRSRYGAADVQPVTLLGFSISNWTIWPIAIMATISLILVLLAKPRTWQPKFEPVRLEESLVNGQKSGRGKRLCLEQINCHLRNIHDIWLHCGFRR